MNVRFQNKDTKNKNTIFLFDVDSIDLSIEYFTADYDRDIPIVKITVTKNDTTWEAKSSYLADEYDIVEEYINTSKDETKVFEYISISVS